MTANRRELIGLLGRERLDIQDFGRMCELIGNLLTSCEARFAELPDIALDKANDILAMAETLAERVLETHRALERREIALVESIEGAASRLRDAEHRLREALGRLNDVGWQAERLRQLFVIAESLSHLPDGQWQRLLDLARALRPVAREERDE